MDLLPKVYRTEGNIAEFDPSKIFESILKETQMNETDAKHITELVVRRIISSGIKFLSGPHIREIVCSILSEQHFENERKLYTRIGMPLMDYEEILEKGLKNKLNERINPEKIHHWAADQITEEYTHLRILSNEESRAHLAGDIHINGLNYFDLRPFSQIWDPRLILENGIPPIDYFNSYYKQKPATNFITALDHLSKWLGMIQSEFYGTQGFNFFTTFLSPFVQNLAEEKIIQEIEKFIYEINQLPLMLGRKMAQTSIILYFSILKDLSNYPVIGPFIKNNNVYGDFKEESLKLFKCLINVYKKQYHNNSVMIPELQIILDNNLVNEIDNIYPNFWNDIQKIKSVNFMNFCLDTNKNKFLKYAIKENFINFGLLQTISLNLPRCAYISRSEDKFLELLNSKINLSSQILLKKYEIITKRINTNHLPFCGGKLKGQSLFKLENQALSFSLVGLNEAMKFITGYELHEDSGAIKFSKKVLNELNTLCSELSKRDEKNYVICENISKKAIQRFTKLDEKHYPEEIKIFLEGNDYDYTNSVHFRKDIKFNLLDKIKIQGEFHRVIDYGAVEYVSFKELRKNGINIKKFLTDICTDSSVSSLKFYS